MHSSRRAVVGMGIVLLLAATGCGGSSGGRAAGEDAGREGEIRVVAYNIRHGRGMDDAIDLVRTAEVLRALRPGIVGLQEVDEEVERSGRVNQAAVLGELLDMTPVFGAFMDYQGGRYGMALLSRYPIARSWEIELPEGNEPRIALAAEVVLPTGERVVAVNVHFDWVRDDGFRYAQASTLAEALDALDLPWILLGDLNDEPGSRTVDLFHARAREAAKPEHDRFTFPSEEPRREIDFIFAGPGDAWRIVEARVIPETVASDHRPVLAVLDPTNR